MRLKTKLLLGFLSSTAFILIVLAALFMGQMLRQRVQTAYSNNNVAAHQILFAVQHALETGLRNENFDVNDPVQLREAVQHTLAQNTDLDSTLDSVLRYSPAVYDVDVVDTANRVLLSTDPTLADQVLPARRDFAHLQDASLPEQIRGVFGRPQVYDVQVPLERNGKPFVTVRVGIRSTFLRAELQPTLRRSLIYTSLLILAAFFVAAVLSGLALQPIETINRRLDELESGASPDPLDADTSAEVAAVSGKIARIGKRIRTVEEVFTTLKGNLDQILTSLQDGLVLFTREGRAVLVSSAAARFLGVEREQILGQEITAVLNRNSVIGRLVLDAFGARVALLQEEVLTEDGRRVQVSLDFIHDDSAPASALGALLTLHDTETEQQLESELEMSRRLAGIGRLTAGVGHEVKNPINAIVVHMELLRNKLAQTPPETQRHLDVIQGEVQRLNRVVNMLVDFTRPVELRLTDENLQQVVEEVLALTGAELQTHQIALRTELAPSQIPVHIDRDLLKQALLNIVQNAAQAMPNGGTLTVRTRTQGRTAMITVEDTGVGIAPELMDKVFNLYFTTKASGSGIGLAMTFRILQLHNGRVLVQSEPGKGSAFTLELPLAAPEKRVPPTPSPAVYSGEAIR